MPRLLRLPLDGLRWRVLVATILLCIFWAGRLSGRLDRQGEIDRLQAELAAAGMATAQARAGQSALAAQAQACLEREDAALADMERWEGIFARMRTRELTHAEKSGVPDNETRRALLGDLDRPL